MVPACVPAATNKATTSKLALCFDHHLILIQNLYHLNYCFLHLVVLRSKAPDATTASNVRILILAFFHVLFIFKNVYFVV